MLVNIDLFVLLYSAMMNVYRKSYCCGIYYSLLLLLSEVDIIWQQQTLEKYVIKLRYTEKKVTNQSLIISLLDLRLYYYSMPFLLLE